MSRRPRRRNCRLFAPRFSLKRISSSWPADAPDKSLELATRPLPRAGIPLHHRTQQVSQNSCHIFPVCANLNSLHRNELQIPYPFRARQPSSTIETYGAFIQNDREQITQFGNRPYTSSSVWVPI